MYQPRLQTGLGGKADNLVIGERCRNEGDSAIFSGEYARIISSVAPVMIECRVCLGSESSILLVLLLVYLCNAERSPVPTTTGPLELA